MIEIDGSAHRSFIFPAELPLAYTYYSDLSRILTYLPHISLLREYAYDRFRVLYSTIELGTYRIRIYCDLQAVLDGDHKRKLVIGPLTGVTPVRAEAGLTSSTTQGYFAMESTFHDEGRQTRIEYNLHLQARLPTPLGLRFWPGAVVHSIAESIMYMRIREIAEGFIERSIDAFPHWLAEIESARCRCSLNQARPSDAGPV